MRFLPEGAGPRSAAATDRDGWLAQLRSGRSGQQWSIRHIDLGFNGVTPNDGPGDADTGPNNLQNFPDITSAKTGLRATTVKGTLESTPSNSFTIWFFKNPESTKEEGKTFIGFKNVTDTDADGIMPFTFKPPKKVKVGQFVTALATNDGGDTSEFSVPRKVRE